MLTREELPHIAGAMIIFTAILSSEYVLKGAYSRLGIAFVGAAIIIATNILAKKLMANLLDADVEHKTWTFQQYGLKAHKHLKKPFLAGILLPLIASIITLGFLKISAFLTYETRAKKIRAAKRFGYYSYSEMTDLHNALIGAAGIITTLFILVISYFSASGLESVAKAAAFYAFWNMLPVSNLDGTQIFFGSKIIWTVLMILSTLAAAYAIFLPLY